MIRNCTSPKEKVSYSLPIKVNTEKLTTNDGLPDNNVCDIYQDKRGFIWFCTLNGLSKYDGNRFVNFKKQNDENKTFYPGICSPCFRGL